MSLILLSQTVFGNLVAFRILRRFGHRSLISTTSLTKIGTAFAFALSSGALWLCFHAHQPLFFVLSGLVVLQLSLKIAEKRRIERLSARFPDFLDRWLLNLRMGFASTIARERALNASDVRFRRLVAPVFEGGNDIHLFLTPKEVAELRAAQAEPHTTVHRLQNLRKCANRAAFFRRKSSQALRQATIQSSVLILLHFGLCAFVFIRGDGGSNFDLIIGSTLLNACGVLTLRLMARRIRWTV
jgi:Flp pilus assembly protein TadB